MKDERGNTSRGRKPLPTAFLALCAAAVLVQARTVGGEVTREDLMIVMPTAANRLSLVEASRKWRKGISTYLVSDQPYLQPEEAKVHREVWGTYRDISNSPLDVGPKQGDLRAAMAPFLANHTIGKRAKWYLYGDDDTVWFVDNVLKLLNSGVLDHRQPYFVSDCLWWGSHEAPEYTKLHPSPMAPRCLPCEYSDPLLEGDGVCPDHEGFIAPKGCPCSPGRILQGGWPGGDPDYFSDGRGIFDRQKGDFVHRPGAFHSPAPGWWYMVHGGAGALISQALLDLKPFEEVEAYLTGIPQQSGDAMVSKAFWNVFHIAPTDPGYGYCRPHVQMFDPGWRGPRARGKEDSGTADAGADPTGMVQRLEWGLAGVGCDEWCQDQLSHTLTVHVRSRYSAQDMFEDYPELGVSDGPPHFRAACHLIERLGELGEKWAARTASSRFIPLWED